jgi:hypothetical protein
VRIPFRRLPPAVLLILALVAALGCGGGNEKDATALLDKAFKQSIHSGDLKLDAEIQLNGNPAFGKPLRIEATGPFRNNKGKLPSADLELRFGSGGQTVQAGFLSTGDRAFTKFQDVYYEQPSSAVRRANRAIAASGGGRQSSLKALGLDPRRWLEGAHTKGDETVAGADTTHVSGKLDVSRVVKDFNDFIKRSGGALGGATGQARPLTKSQVDKVSQVLKDPSFDVYVAKSDHTIRRLSGHVDLEVPKSERSSVGGIEGGSLSFTIEFSKVNGNQTIQAPARARPLSDLTKALGTGLLGGASDSTGGAAPGSKAEKRYRDCLNKTNPRNTDALQRCADLLQ